MKIDTFEERFPLNELLQASVRGRDEHVEARDTSAFLARFRENQVPVMARVATPAARPLAADLKASGGSGRLYEPSLSNVRTAARRYWKELLSVAGSLTSEGLDEVARSEDDERLLELMLVLNARLLKEGDRALAIRKHPSLHTMSPEALAYGPVLAAALSAESTGSVSQLARDLTDRLPKGETPSAPDVERWVAGFLDQLRGRLRKAYGA